jgi:hypothetical protein
MATAFVVTYPVYAILSKDATTTVFLRHGQDLWLPLFTDQASLLTYAGNEGLIDHIAVELPTPLDVRLFVTNPPSRGGVTTVTTIVVDPIDNKPRVVSLFSLANFLALL